MKIDIREIESTEIPLLEKFLYEAIFIREGQEKPDKKIIKEPKVFCYIKDFGKNTDLCLLAVTDGNPIGAVWTRIYSVTEKGYGFVDSNTPELSMSVLENYRNNGIGTKLLAAMIDKLTEQNCKQVSLSVDKMNFAYKMYQKFGFETIESNEESAIMLKRLK